MLMPADAVESWLNVDQRCGKPSMPLFRVTPPLDVSGQVLGHAVYGSIQLVVLKLFRRSGIVPRRWMVNVSSSPSSRLLTAYWFIRVSSGFKDRRSALASLYVGFS